MKTNQIKTREKISLLKKQLTVSKIYSVIITLCFLGMGFLYMTKANADELKLQDTILSYESTLKNINDNYQILVDHYDGFTETINNLVEISEELNSENLSLVKSNESYYQELQDYKQREELYNKYEYALYDKSGERTDITYDQLITVEDLVNRSIVHDEDLILAWIMVESNGKEQAKNVSSSAKGYGQLLDSTSKFVYTDLLNHSNSEWSSSIALDGNTNLEMMVAYIDYLYEQCDGNLYNVIRSYGGYDSMESARAYAGKINSYLSVKDKSIDSIQLDLSKE